MAGLTGLEPATSSVTGWHSNQLSYNPEYLLSGFKEKKEGKGILSPCVLVGETGIEPVTSSL